VQIFELFRTSILVIDEASVGVWKFHRNQEATIRQIFEYRQYMFDNIYCHPNTLIIERQMVKAARQLSVDWSDLATFLSYTDASFIAAISQVPEGQRLLRGDCDDLSNEPLRFDPQAPSLALPRIPFYEHTTA